MIFDTNRGPMSEYDIRDTLTYINYAANRDMAPEVTPDKWKRIYGNDRVEQMEAWYQAERAMRKAAA